MATSFKLGLSRDQLATFLKDHEQIRQFEQLFTTVAQSEDVTVIDVAITAASALATANQASDTNHIVTDYIDFDPSPPHSNKPARAVWNAVDDTLNLHHNYNVTQQVGQESYIRVQNVTGSTIPDGSVVGFTGAGSFNTPTVSKFLADGSQPTLYALGVMTQTLPDSGEIGFCTTFGKVRDIDTTGSPVGETWSLGNILYASPSIAGALTNIKPTAPDNVVPIAAVLSVSATVGAILVRPTIEQDKKYGQFTRATSLTAAAINTAYAIPLTNTSISQGVSIGTPASRLLISRSGFYRITVGYNTSSSNASVKSSWFWLRINGVDVPSSSVISSISVNNANLTTSRSDDLSLLAGDYIELMWAVDDTALSLSAAPATTFAPSAPSVTVSIDQIQQ